MTSVFSGGSDGSSLLSLTQRLRSAHSTLLTTKYEPNADRYLICLSCKLLFFLSACLIRAVLGNNNAGTHSPTELAGSESTEGWLFSVYKTYFSRGTHDAMFLPRSSVKYRQYFQTCARLSHQTTQDTQQLQISRLINPRCAT